MTVGVVVVAYDARDVIVDCLESLLASRGVDLRIVVVDNASTDDTVAVIEEWAAAPGYAPGAKAAYFEPVAHGPIALVPAMPGAGLREIALLRSPTNTGFAGGVNAGLRLLHSDPEVDYFWVFNPDCIAENTTAQVLEAYAAKVGRFGLIGGRIFYQEPPLMIQNDGGRINFMTGTCIPHNLGRIGRDVPAPEGTELDYISGAHMFASRLFLDTAGLMPEEYFLYYEEMDWCCRRGDLPMYFCVEAGVHHEGGHTLGSATLSKGPSPISAYFMGRSRMIFVRRYRPLALPLTFVYCLAKVAKSILKGQFQSGFSLLRGICGLGPSAAVRARLSPDMSFGTAKATRPSR